MQKEISKKYKKYEFKNSINKKTLKELCKPPTKFTLQPPQKFLADIMKSKLNGILVFHKIGSGKTCTAIRIAEEHKNKKNIVVVLPASLVTNFRDELRTLCAEDNYMTKKERLEFDDKNEKDRSLIIEKTNERIDKYYTIYSYNKFVSLIDTEKINLENTLLIIDEVQNMISETGVYYQKLYNFIKNGPSNLKIVLLSATPIFDKPVEIALTLNLLPLKTLLPIGTEFNETFIETDESSKGIPIYKFINRDLFTESTSGFISFYRGMPEKSFPRSNLSIVKCKMENFQYKSYQLVLKKEKNKSNKKIDLLKLPNNFFISSRMISNIAYPNRKANADGFESFVGDKLKLKNLKKYSIKFYKIIKNLKKTEGKGFIYSNFVEYGGLKPLAVVLEQNGYVNFKHRDTTSKKNPKFYAVWSGEETLDYKQLVKYTFNLKDSNLRLILGSPAIKEGVSLKRVRQIHILEPYWNNSRFEQIVGRGLRYCSHADLPLKQQEVDIFLYISHRPKENSYKDKTKILDKMSVDRYINYLAISKQHLISQFEGVLKSNAIDCIINKNINNVKCDQT